MAQKTVTDQSFQSDVLDSKTPVVVDFWAEWCGPCRMIAPSLEELASEYDGKVIVAKMNIDENPQTPDALWRARASDADDLPQWPGHRNEDRRAAKDQNQRVDRRLHLRRDLVDRI